MNIIRFSIFTFVGSFLWCIPLTWAGYHWGPEWEHFRERARYADYPVAAIVLAVLVWFVWHRLRQLRETDGAGIAQG